jgi:hypothetical protein
VSEFIDPKEDFAWTRAALSDAIFNGVSVDDIWLMLEHVESGKELYAAVSIQEELNRVALLHEFIG